MGHPSATLARHSVNCTHAARLFVSGFARWLGPTGAGTFDGDGGGQTAISLAKGSRSASTTAVNTGVVRTRRRKSRLGTPSASAASETLPHVSVNTRFARSMDRRRRQAQGIVKAKSGGKYPGRPEDTDRLNGIAAMLRAVPRGPISSSPSGAVARRSRSKSGARRRAKRPLDIVEKVEFPRRSQLRRPLAASMEISLGAQRSNRSFCVRPSLRPCGGNYPWRQHYPRGNGIFAALQFPTFSTISARSRHLPMGFEPSVGDLAASQFPDPPRLAGPPDPRI